MNFNDNTMFISSLLYTVCNTNWTQV